MARRTEGTGDYELTLRFDPARMDVALKLAEPAGGPLANLLQYPDLGALSVTASLHGPRAAERIQVAARAGELRAEVQGSIDLNRESADLSYSLEAPAMTAASRALLAAYCPAGALAGTCHWPRRRMGDLRSIRCKIPGVQRSPRSAQT